MGTIWLEGEFRPVQSNCGGGISNNDLEAAVTVVNERIDKIEDRLVKLETKDFEVKSETLILL